MSEPIPTPRTDAATHDDWSGGAEAVEVEVSRALETECTRLRTALRSLSDAADAHVAQQDKARHPQVGITQPITKQEGIALYEAYLESIELLAELDSQQKQP